MKFTVIILGVVFVLYVLWIALRFGIRKSISDSYYVLAEIRQGYIFTLFMLFLFSCLIYITALTNHQYSWSFFLAGAGAAFVGMATTFYESATRIAHFFGASLLIIFSLLGIGLVYSNWIPSYFTILTILVFYLLRHKQFKVIYWFEILVFVFIILGLYIQ